MPTTQTQSSTKSRTSKKAKPVARKKTGPNGKGAWGKGPSRGQHVMLFGLFRRACQVAHCDEDRQTRMEWTFKALGEYKSWSKLNNGDVDKLKSYFQLIIDADDIDARMRHNNPEDQERERLLIGMNQQVRKHPNAEAMSDDDFDDWIGVIAIEKFGKDIHSVETLPMELLEQLHITIHERIDDLINREKRDMLLLGIDNAMKWHQNAPEWPKSSRNRFAQDVCAEHYPKHKGTFKTLNMQSLPVLQRHIITKLDQMESSYKYNG